MTNGPFAFSISSLLISPNSLAASIFLTTAEAFSGCSARPDSSKHHDVCSKSLKGEETGRARTRRRWLIVDIVIVESIVIIVGILVLDAIRVIIKETVLIVPKVPPPRPPILLTYTYTVLLIVLVQLLPLICYTE